MWTLKQVDRHHYSALVFSFSLHQRDAWHKLVNLQPNARYVDIIARISLYSVGIHKSGFGTGECTQPEAVPEWSSSHYQRPRTPTLSLPVRITVLRVIRPQNTTIVRLTYTHTQTPAELYCSACIARQTYFTILKFLMVLRTVYAIVLWINMNGNFLKEAYKLCQCCSIAGGVE